VIGGLAELFSGAISMGLGAYLASVTERDHYFCEEARERMDVRTKPDDEREEIFQIMDKYGLSREATKPFVDQLCRGGNEDMWVQVWLRLFFADFVFSFCYDGFVVLGRGLRVHGCSL
jgi:VIT1/CCC1 family predicted Fe2+/Mn2+ transporter